MNSKWKHRLTRGQALSEGLPSVRSLVLMVAVPGGKRVCCPHIIGPWGQVEETVGGRCSEQCLASSRPSMDPGSRLMWQCWVTKRQSVELSLWGVGRDRPPLLSTYCMPGLQMQVSTW